MTEESCNIILPVYKIRINVHIIKTVFLCLSEQFPKVEKKIFKEIMHFHHMTLMATPWFKTPLPRGHETHNFSRLFIGHHYNIHVLSLSELCLGVDKTIF